jgi:radical SAM protein with 4Fe4S-binding SPASM domain
MPILQVTTKIGCKLSCSYCPQDKFITAYKDKSSKYSMSLGDFQIVLDKLPSNVNIWFAGMCEPWLNSECTEMLLYAHKKAHRISVATTLFGLKLSDIDLIASIPFGFFKIHLPSDNGRENILVNEDYLSVVEKILKSNIPTSFHCHTKHCNLKVKLLLNNYKNFIYYSVLWQRAGNITLKKRMKLRRRHGVIGCKRKLQNNVLLPNGDVLLCSNDYGMKHILGNLISSSYDSLFGGNELQKIRRGQQNESVDILCRNCENFVYNVDSLAKFTNFPYQVDRYFYYLKDLHNVENLKIIKQKGLYKIKNIFKLS